MEFSGQKRSNLLVASIVWWSISVWYLIKAVPHNIPLRSVSSETLYHASVFYMVFAVGLLIIALLGRDRKLLYAYAVVCVFVLIALMLQDVEIAEEREKLNELRDHFVGFFLLPHWGWSRVLKENVSEWISVGNTFLGAVAFFAARLNSAR